MRTFIALAAGYVIGARAGSRDLDELTSALKALRDSDELADVVSALRSHAGHTLRALAATVDGRPPGQLDDGAETGDLVDRVRHLVGRG
ncbi:MAG TPA: hypothetical protein VKB57_21525 [Acidimicrobiales bacterium]|nr:hypothetical protein [Acidimicrobiales bacterium]